jgi:hypothetical protein
MNNIIAQVSSFILGIGAIAAFLIKVLPKLIKYVHVAAHATKILDDAFTALNPNPALGETKPTLTEAEINQLYQDILDFKAALKS